MEEYCISVVKVIKDAFGWHGDICTEKGVGAWIGEAPDYLRVVESDSGSEDAPSGTIEKDNIEGVKASAQDIASYQVIWNFYVAFASRLLKSDILGNNSLHN